MAKSKKVDENKEQKIFGKDIRPERYIDELGVTSRYDRDTITKAIALYSLYHNFNKVGEIMGIGSQTVAKWIHGMEENEKLKEVYKTHGDIIQKDLMAATSITMEKALQVVYDKLDEASSAQAATIFGILFDKRNIMMGNASATNTNVIIDTSGMSDDDKAQLLRRALSRTEPVSTTAEVVDIEE